MIGFITKFLVFIDRLDPKTLHRAFGAFIIAIVLIISLIIVQYYRTVNYLLKEINDTNELREEVKTVLDKAQQTHQQQITVNQMLAKDPNFKIRGYCEKTLEKLHLSDKGKCSVTERTEREDNYLETKLNAEFVNMTMKELTELLQELEQSPRIFTKELDIVKSKKTAHAIDVKLVIGTLQPKTAESE